jgi:hypothetical protein
MTGELPDLECDVATPDPVVAVALSQQLRPANSAWQANVKALRTNLTISFMRNPQAHRQRLTCLQLAQRPCYTLRF